MRSDALARSRNCLLIYSSVPVAACHVGSARDLGINPGGAITWQSLGIAPHCLCVGHEHVLLRYAQNTSANTLPPILFTTILLFLEVRRW